MMHCSMACRLTMTPQIDESSSLSAVYKQVCVAVGQVVCRLWGCGEGGTFLSVCDNADVLQKLRFITCAPAGCVVTFLDMYGEMRAVNPAKTQLDSCYRRNEVQEQES